MINSYLQISSINTSPISNTNSRILSKRKAESKSGHSAGLPAEETGVAKTLLLGLLLMCLTEVEVELLLRLTTLFSREVSLDTVLFGTCGAEAILLWLLDTWAGLF